MTTNETCVRKSTPESRRDVQDRPPARQARLHALLFTSVVLGTTLLTFATLGPKVPFGAGDA